MNNTYEKIWGKVFPLVPGNNLVEREAKTHELMMEICPENIAKIAFQAILGHVRLEIHGYNPKIYLKIFSQYSWCKRIIEGKVL